MKRVVVTGLGSVSPFGFGAEHLFESVLNNSNGITKITDIPAKGEIIQIAASLPEPAKGQKTKHSALEHRPIPEDDSINSYVYALDESLVQSGLPIESIMDNSDTGVFIGDRQLGASVYIDQTAPLMAQACDENGNMNDYTFFKLLQEHNPGKKSEYNDSDTFAHYICRSLNITGEVLSIGTACASANNAIGEAFLKIRAGRLTNAIAGGAFNYDLLGMIGFTRIGALTVNPDPDTACSPFDKRRSGFVMGSGAGILILEEMESAKKRGANILCEITGYGSFCDAYRATDPDPEASGATRTMKYAVDMAGLNSNDISYVNAHGTSTNMNDYMETMAIKKVLGEDAYNTPISSTKSMIGHSITAAGALEGIVCIHSLLKNVIHPTRNWAEQDTSLDLDYVPNQAREIQVDNIMSNNFGFGGQNATVIFSKYKG